MTFQTFFDIGDTVRVRSTRKSFKVGQIRIETLRQGALVLIQYRANYATGRNGAWVAEGDLYRAPQRRPPWSTSKKNPQDGD